MADKFEPHMPYHYVGGVYIRQHEEWVGQFVATCEQLVNYSTYDVTTVEEYDLVITLLIAQQEYEDWWRRVREKK